MHICSLTFSCLPSLTCGFKILSQSIKAKIVQSYDYNSWEEIRKTPSSLVTKLRELAGLIQMLFPLYCLHCFHSNVHTARKNTENTHSPLPALLNSLDTYPHCQLEMENGAPSNSPALLKFSSTASSFQDLAFRFNEQQMVQSLSLHSPLSVLEEIIILVSCHTYASEEKGYIPNSKCVQNKRLKPHFYVTLKGVRGSCCLIPTQPSIR